MTDTTTSGLELLRKPFPPNQISKLPKPTKAQTDELKANLQAGIRCQLCGAWHHPKVVHLDYVGHAALTDRLLDADPMWSWEPMAFSADGLPARDQLGGLWIRLTVCGVTRLGYGHAGDKTGGDAIKELIGDALRNAAMRFGAALDLWHKGQLHDDPEPKPEQTALTEHQIADWKGAIETATAEELPDIHRDALAAATKAKDRAAYAVFRATAEKRKAAFA